MTKTQFFLIFLFIAFLIYGGYLLKQEPVFEIDSDNFGTIEGLFQYPNGINLGDILVCAKNINSQKTNCTKDYVYDDERYNGELGYYLELVPGDYQVFATNNKDFILYYSSPCSKSEPITVIIKGGINKQGINIMK